MTIKTALLRGVAFGVLSALAAGASAHAEGAETHHHHRHHVAAKAEESATSQEITALRAEVEALKARLDSQSQQQQATAAQVAQTQSQVQEVAASAESAQDKIETLPEQINVAVGQLPKPKPSWADKTQLGSTVFMDMSDIEQKNNDNRVAPSGTAFDIKRAYLSIDHSFNDVYSADLTTDFQYNSTVGATELYVKKAFLQAKYFNWLTVRAGAADLPWVPFVEGLYGYRYVENVLIDRTKFGTSTDWGLHVLGSLDPIGGATGPVISYQVSAIDGTGYKAPPGTGSAPRTDTLDVEGRLSVKWMDFTAAIGGYDGKLGKDAGTTYNAASVPITYHTASRFDAILAYTGGPIRAGVEYLNATDYTAVTSKAPDQAEAYSVFGSYQLTPMWAVFGRFDHTDPNQKTAPSKTDNYYNLGLGYTPTKGVDLSLVYRHDKVDDGTFSTSNGTIGNSTTIAAGPNNGTYDEIGLFAQLKY